MIKRLQPGYFTKRALFFFFVLGFLFVFGLSFTLFCFFVSWVAQNPGASSENGFPAGRFPRKFRALQEKGSCARCLLVAFSYTFTNFPPWGLHPGGPILIALNDPNHKNDGLIKFTLS